jgi:hypothetical protein
MSIDGFPAGPTKEQAVAVLDEVFARLGADADAVAASLLERGIRGEKVNCETCPIATLIATTDLGGGFFPIYPIYVAVVANVAFIRLTSALTLFVPLPDPVRGFIGRFDLGDWPDLEGDPGTALAQVADA